MNSYRIPEMARKYMEYDMITKYTDLPHFPDIRARLLYSFLSRQSAFSSYSELFTLVTTLVQMGLDTHDMVSINNNVKEMAASRSRQLKVLAGDYFSGRFYYLLSHAGHIDLIGVISEAICEANRMKMSLYQLMMQGKMTAADYLKGSVEIKIQLFLPFTAKMDGAAQALWPEVLRLFTECEVLMHEIHRSETAQKFKDSWGYWHTIEQGSKEEKRYLLQAEALDSPKLRAISLKYKIAPQLYQLLSSTMKQLKDKLHSLESKEWSQELQLIGEPLMQYLSTPKAMEEI